MDSLYKEINDRYVCRYKKPWKIMSKKTSIEKREDEAMGGDGVVTMRHMKKKIMEQNIVCM